MLILNVKYNHIGIRWPFIPLNLVYFILYINNNKLFYYYVILCIMMYNNMFLFS